MISAKCPELMCVNMYVTGLLMYYAGQISCKLVDEINHTDDEEIISRAKPKVVVTFAGKGARLLQWLAKINQNVAQNYYGQMFILGFGDSLKQVLAGWPKIILPTADSAEIKYEVSKGLAKGDTKLQSPLEEDAKEIIGENGFELICDGKATPVNYINSITPEMIENIGVYFTAPDPHKAVTRFVRFCELYYKAIRQLFRKNIPNSVWNQAFSDMNIVNYVQNMPEFSAAMRERDENQSKFNFVAPIIILEGMKFYDEVLLDALSKQLH